MESQQKDEKQKSFVRRDKLIEMQSEVQKQWSKQNPFESNIDIKNPKKYFVTFPYPYVNGALHMGHAFSFSKADFSARYKRLMGYNVLFPQAYHCTGMPISAAADKLRAEIEKYGNPPVFPDDKTMFQYRILQKMGLSDEIIPKFADPYFWLEYFPPLAHQDLQQWGAPVDWRRSFITTDKNPYYDSFIRWQFTLLKERGYIKFGKRPSIYCIRDNQMCADHDRSEGEGIGPQEYTLIKIKVLGWKKEELKKQFEGKHVFLVAATLRPETMFGQTNCFILPTGLYGAFRMKGEEIFICSDRSALNMAYQNLSFEDKKVEKICNISGEDLLGLPLKAPLTQYPVVYSLPMMTIKMDKGTGVVTSVPSDAPDDWAAYRDLQNKDKLREKFGITEEMVSLKPIPIIDIPGYGSMAAQAVCDKLGIQSQNDKEKLLVAKEETYKLGFYEGVMTGEAVGKYSGMKVIEAKNLVREDMLQQGLAAVYYEPEGKVVARSQTGTDEECIVAFCDQWYIRYGEKEWRDKVYQHCTTNFKMYSQISYNQIKFTIDWLKEWGCSRNYGLGTRMPFDEKYLIESLSDSTIYMSYYTIAHFLQGNIEGSQPGSLGIKPEQLTRQVWDYIFQGVAYDSTTMQVEESKLKAMRDEFLYWYPLDLRVSAKDLVRNHLTMSLYNHAAIWENEPNLWPRSYFTNGYVNINGKPMSKSKGNFYTINDIVKEYGSDATRFACAEAGDGLDDANFTTKNTEESILKLATIETWIKLIKGKKFRTDDQGDQLLNFYDRAFENQMNQLLKESVRAFENMRFRDVTKYGFHQFTSIKEYYLINCGGDQGVGPRRDLILKWIEYQLLILNPITPFFSEFVYKNHFLEMVGEERSTYPESINDHRFPDINQIQLDFATIRSMQSYNEFLHSLRRNKQSQGQNKKGEKIEMEKIIIVYAKEFHEWQKKVMDLVKQSITINENNDSIISDNWRTAVKQDPVAGGKNMPLSMGFGSYLAQKFADLGEQVLDYSIDVDQSKLLNDHIPKIKKELDVENIELIELSQISTLPPAIVKQIKDVQPFNPKDIWIPKK